MSRDWKPGDVAADVNNDERAMVVARRSMGCGEFHPDKPHWHYASSDWNPLGVDSIRPLVVIDPEDSQQVERLRDYLEAECDWFGMREDNTVEHLTDAIRSLLTDPTPPKPEEPTGLGAVIEDAEGNRWVRAFALRLAWTDALFSENCREYADIDAVRILANGVSE